MLTKPYCSALFKARTARNAVMAKLVANVLMGFGIAASLYQLRTP
jgi:hypothetical protein